MDYPIILFCVSGRAFFLLPVTDKPASEKNILQLDIVEETFSLWTVSQ